jgi:hypothetical protein
MELIIMKNINSIWEVNSLKLVKICLLFHQLVTIENTQLKEHFAYLIFELPKVWKKIN